MYPLTPMKVYMLERVQDDPRCVARMERMLKAVGVRREEVVCVTERNVAEVAQELQKLWPPATVPPGQVRSYMRPWVLTTMDLSYKRDFAPLLKRLPPGTPAGIVEKIYGSFTTAIDQHPHHLDQRNNCVCWPTYNFGTMSGCPHGCLYCGTGRGGRTITIALNLEEYMTGVAQ